MLTHLYNIHIADLVRQFFLTNSKIESMKCYCDENFRGKLSITFYGSDSVHLLKVAIEWSFFSKCLIWAIMYYSVSNGYKKNFYLLSNCVEKVNRQKSLTSCWGQKKLLCLKINEYCSVCSLCGFILERKKKIIYVLSLNAQPEQLSTKLP